MVVRFRVAFARGMTSCRVDAPRSRGAGFQKRGSRRRGVSAWLLPGVVLVLVGAFTPVRPVQADEATARRFLAEAPPAWERLRSGLRQGFVVEFTATGGAGPAEVLAEGTDEESMELRVQGVRERVTTESAVEPGQRELVGITKQGGPGPTTVVRLEAVNESYGFQLERFDDADPWSLAGVDLDLDQTEHGRRIPAVEHAFMGLLIEGDPFENLIKSAGFEILSAQPGKTESGEEVCEIEFRSRHVVDKWKNTILGGTARFLPGRYWTLLGYRVREQSRTTGTIEQNFSYQNLDGYPFPKQVINTGSFPPEPRTRYVYDFGAVTRDVEEGDFKLSSFDFPEPIVKPRRSIPLVGWLFVAAVVLSVGAVVVRRLMT